MNGFLLIDQESKVQPLARWRVRFAVRDVGEDADTVVEHEVRSWSQHGALQLAIREKFGNRGWGQLHAKRVLAVIRL